jgi:hypothetical protein
MAAVVVTATTVGVRVASSSAGPPRPVPAHAAPHATARGPDALAVLRRWDRRRAQAWSAGDPAALTALYVAGSRTGRRDERDLRRWSERGLRVRGLRQQIAALSLRRRTSGRLTVVVVDRTVKGVALGGPYPWGLPRSAWLAHRITLRRVGGAWRVVEARAQPAR